MPKNLSDNTSSSSKYFGKGVFVDRCKILNVEDVSNYPKAPKAEIITIGNNGWQPELCLKLKIDSGIEQVMYIMGSFNYRTDPVSGKRLDYIGWKKAGNAVQNLIVKLGLGEGAVGDDDTIMPSVLQALPGKEFFRLRYCQTRDKDYEGKPSFQNWNVFAPAVEGNDEALVNEFHKIAVKIKKYDPNRFDDYNEEQKKREATFNKEDFAPGDDVM